MKRWIIVAATAALVLPVILGIGHAEVAPVAPVVVVEAPSVWEQFWREVQGPHYAFLTAVAIAALGFGTKWLGQIVGDNRAAKLNEIVQSALKNAAGLALNDLGERVLSETIKASEPAVVAGVARVRAAIPDTIAKIEAAQGGRLIQDSHLAGGLIGKLNEMVAPAMGSMLAPAMTGGDRLDEDRDRRDRLRGLPEKK